MNPDRESRLTEIFRRLFSLPELVLTDDLTARDVPGWDSLNHVTLLIEVEREFGLRFTSHEIEALRSVGDLKTLIETKVR
jgi:acyl carrier protein